MGYAELTGPMGTLRLERGWTDAELAGGLGHVELIGLEALEMSAGVPWTLGDLLVVGVCGGLGSVAAVAEDAEAGLPATDDVPRAFRLLGEIRRGRWGGVSWAASVRDLGAHFGFHPVTGYTDALTLWLRHLADDTLVPFGLPEPGWMRLFDLPIPEIRQFAREALAEAKLGAGTPIVPGPAGSTPAGLTASLPAIVVEVLVRTHVHWTTYLETGSARLNPAGRQKLEEMVRSAHALLAATALTQVAGEGLGTADGESADVRTLIGNGLTAVEVVRARRARYGVGAGGWLEGGDLPWSSPDAPTLAARLDRLRG